MATQKVPLTRIDETDGSDGQVLKISSGAVVWGTDNTGGGGGGGGGGTAFKNTILGTESVSVNSLEQYQVHSGLEILSGGSFTISLSGDLVLDAPDDPHKAAGWTDAGNVIHTTDNLNQVVIGQTTALSADDKLSVAGGNLTVAGAISAQGNLYSNDIHGNNIYGDNIGKVLQVAQYFAQGQTQNEDWWSGSSISTWTKMHYLSAQFDNPLKSNSKILARLDGAIGVSGDSSSWAANINFTFYNDGNNMVPGGYGFKVVNISTRSNPNYQIEPFSGCYLFTPTDTYGNVQMYWKPTGVHHTTYFGRAGVGYYTPTQLTIMEIAQ